MGVRSVPRRAVRFTSMGRAIFILAVAVSFSACWKKNPGEKFAASTSAMSGSPVAPVAPADAGKPAASPEKAVVPARVLHLPDELVRRAKKTSQAARESLKNLRAAPSAYGLGDACGVLGSLEAFLVALAFAVNDGLLVEKDPKGEALADPLQWTSSAQTLAPLCHRRGSSLDDFLEDIGSVEKNITQVESALARLAVP